MKHAARPVCLLILVIAGSRFSWPIHAHTQARPDFSGTWVLDAAKSQLGDLPPPKSQVLTIVHKDPEVRVDRVIDDDRKDSSTFRTDGKETTQEREGAGSIVFSGRWNGSTLLRRVRAATFSQDDTWTVSPDGSRLTIVRSIEQGGEVVTLHMVFLKKQ